jgi:hypothetical protein
MKGKKIKINKLKMDHTDPNTEVKTIKLLKEKTERKLSDTGFGNDLCVLLGFELRTSCLVGRHYTT